jgi:hypothetical protein
MASNALTKAPKKTAKKATKKTAKKAPKKAPSHRAGHDLRRAYEHISRVRTLHLGLQPAALTMVDSLSRMAQAAMAASDGKSAAEFLRAAEHVAFGYLTSAERDASLSDALIAAANDEYDHLEERARDHAPAGRGELRSIYNTLLGDSGQAMKQGAYHRGLELVRAAEALTHGTPAAAQRKLPAGMMTLQLK